MVIRSRNNPNLVQIIHLSKGYLDACGDLRTLPLSRRSPREIAGCARITKDLAGRHLLSTDLAGSLLLEGWDRREEERMGGAERWSVATTPLSLDAEGQS